MKTFITPSFTSFAGLLLFASTVAAQTFDHPVDKDVLIASSKTTTVRQHHVKREETTAYLLQPASPSTEEQKDLNDFLTHDVRGRELLYFMLYQKKQQQPIYFVFSKTLDKVTGHQEFTLDRNALNDFKDQSLVRQFILGLSYSSRSQSCQPVVDVGAIHETDVLVVVLGKGKHMPTNSKTSTRVEASLEIGLVKENLYVVELHRDMLRGGPRFSH